MPPALPERISAQAAKNEIRHRNMASEQWVFCFVCVACFVDLCVSFVSVDKNGDVCISILHEPGDDKFGYEKASERWLPVHTVETILISVISMLADPNDESPANVDAAVSVVVILLSCWWWFLFCDCRKSGGSRIRNSKGKWPVVFENPRRNVSSNR